MPTLLNKPGYNDGIALYGLLRGGHCGFDADRSSMIRVSIGRPSTPPLAFQSSSPSQAVAQLDPRPEGTGKRTAECEHVGSRAAGLEHGFRFGRLRFRGRFRAAGASVAAGACVAAGASVAAGWASSGAVVAAGCAAGAAQADRIKAVTRSTALNRKSLYLIELPFISFSSQKTYQSVVKTRVRYQSLTCFLLSVFAL
jgi:hypothetical protein